MPQIGVKQVFRHYKRYIALIKNEEFQKLYECILKLPARYSELIYMFYFSDLSITEIAGITGQTNGSIKTALSRARVKLKQMIREDQM